MTSIPRITEGLNLFTPDLFKRMGEAIEAYEAGIPSPDPSVAVRAPSFWASIIGFKYLNPSSGEGPDNSSKPLVRAYEYMWSGPLGNESGTDPDAEGFNPAYNLVEIKASDPADVATYLGLNVTRLRNEGRLFRNMPYINSGEEITDTNGNLIVGQGEFYQPDTVAVQAPVVRMWPVSVYFDYIQENTAYVVHAFSATPMFDGVCQQT
jgi:hypothetical protein